MVRRTFTSRSLSSGSYAADLCNGVWGREGDNLRERIINQYSICICMASDKAYSKTVMDPAIYLIIPILSKL